MPFDADTTSENSYAYSVVIPSRGRRAMLLTALESVYAQTLPPEQVIVVLDGDIDHSEDAVRTAYPDVLLIVHSEATGPARARSDGLRAASSDWVCLLDDDDIWHHDKQANFARYLRENPSCRALRSAFWQFSENPHATVLNGFRTEIFGRASRESLESTAETATPENTFEYLDIVGHSLEAMLRKNCGVTSSTMIHREVLKRITEVPDTLRTAQDWLLFVYVAAETEWHLVPGRWFFYRVHSAQITTDQRMPKWKYRVQAWEHGWKFAGVPSGLELRPYADEYSGEVHRWLWEALSQGKFGEAIQIYRAGSMFIDSTLLRGSVFLPPPIRWRLRGPLEQLTKRSRARPRRHRPSSAEHSSSQISRPRGNG